MSSSHPIITFFRGGEDYQGRTLTDILTWRDDELEHQHDYVQIVFPLPERSAITSHAPVVNREVFEAFHEDEKLRAELRRAWIRISGFYGFEIKSDVENGSRVVIFWVS